MNSVEDAYSAIARALIAGAGGPWDLLALETKILDENCSEMRVTQLSNANEASIALDFQSAFAVSDACIYLRVDLQRANDSRIWGLKFTLQPSGKFNIEYGYNKPADYKE